MGGSITKSNCKRLHRSYTICHTSKFPRHHLKNIMRLTQSFTILCFLTCASAMTYCCKCNRLSIDPSYRFEPYCEDHHPGKCYQCDKYATGRIEKDEYKSRHPVINLLMSIFPHNVNMNVCDEHGYTLEQKKEFVKQYTSWKDSN